ncbi:hypothetical protein F183_A08500 [Bryobacterales bacterium F-183]|nr:hypothetical protein F183_A08500 [Bryobacterales bacterium F-183]
MAVIQIPDEQAELLKQRAAAQGLTLEAWLRQIADSSITASPKPFKNSRGLLAEFGPAPSAEEIDEARRQVWGWAQKDQ